MRAVVLLACAALASTGCAGWVSDSGRGTPTLLADLEISVWRRGSDGPVRVSTLRCSGDSSACAKLVAVDDPFAPVPDNVACIEIYGGPQVAEVRGTFRGRRVVASFNRTNGCEIDRWDRVAFLFR